MLESIREKKIAEPYCITLGWWYDGKYHFKSMYHAPGGEEAAGEAARESLLMEYLKTHPESPIL